MKLLVSITATITASALAAGLVLQPPTNRTAERAIETVTIEPDRFLYRLPGEFLKAGRIVDGPQQSTLIHRPLEIMAYQVSTAEYGACVADGACRPPDGPDATGDLPVTGVSFQDAIAYAGWLSVKTGERWRLPTDEEWAFAAAERLSDDALGTVETDARNPAARWLAAYRERNAGKARDMTPKRRGTFGANRHDLVDIAGNVWEWTSTCYVRAHMDAGGERVQSTENCGVRVTGGRHRGYMTSFLRDGKSGGCAAGMAPDNLGFRLVKDPEPSIAQRLFKSFARS